MAGAGAMTPEAVDTRLALPASAVGMNVTLYGSIHLSASVEPETANWGLAFAVVDGLPAVDGGLA